MEPRRIFLSHRSADKPIADVISKHLGLWGFDNDCYQASAPGIGPTAGQFITNDLREALYHAKLVILVYTLTDYDWSFCMWECGLATHPKKSDARTVVFQCNPHDTPRVFEGQQLVRLDKEGVKDFVAKFFREEGFFPGEDALRPTISDDVIDNYAEEFFKAVTSVIPPGKREERYRWDFITLQLTQGDIVELKQIDGAAIAQRASCLHSRCRAVKAFGSALKHFGYADLEPDLNLEQLINRWKTNCDGNGNHAARWIEELSSEVCRAIDNAPANPQWQMMSSSTFKNSFYFPVVNHVRILPDGSMEFDVYFYQTTGLAAGAGAVR